MGPEFLGDGGQAQEANINKGKSLKENVEVFLRRKNEAVGKLDELFEVLAAALVVELSPVVERGLGGFVCMFMLVLMRLAMRAEVGGQAEAAQQHVGLGAVMELDIPIGGDPEHQQGDEEGSYLQPTFFHGAKLQKTIISFTLSLKLPHSYATTLRIPCNWALRKRPHPKIVGCVGDISSVSIREQSDSQ